MEEREVLEYIKQAFDLKSQGCYKQAVEMLYKALEAENDNAEILFQLGELYFLLQNYGRASKYLERVLVKNPKHIDSLKLLRKIYFSLCDYKQAYVYAEKCMDLEKSSQNLSKLIEISGKLNNTSVIKEWEDDKLMSDEVLYAAANAYYENKDFNSAKDILKKAYAENPDNENILVLLGKIYFDENDFEKSKEIF
ncbi:MAG: tetratricopeptide repeat protein, partial [Candidatus Gastranaerophilaceae bacterium]